MAELEDRERTGQTVAVTAADGDDSTTTRGFAVTLHGKGSTWQPCR